MTYLEVLRHMETVRRLSKPGGSLAPDAPTATVRNPDWWKTLQEPADERGLLHRELFAKARRAAPRVKSENRAIVLAGPPGAGKSTILTHVLGKERENYLTIDADDFKRLLLQEAIEDGSYESWIKPGEIRELEEQGEKFFPLELASLVHAESSFLAGKLRRKAIKASENIIIDTVLSSTESALQLGGNLAARDYEVHVINVEVPYELSEARIRARWEEAYTAALDGGDQLGGRWVPSAYAREVFAGGKGKSKPEIAAQELAMNCQAVKRYQLFRAQPLEDGSLNATTKLELDLSREKNSDLIVNTKNATSTPEFPSRTALPGVGQYFKSQNPQHPQQGFNPPGFKPPGY